MTLVNIIENGGEGASSGQAYSDGETFPWVGLTSPNTGTTCSSGCQNTGGTQTKIGPLPSTTITKPCTCCSLPENSMVLQMRPLSATCKSIWPSFIDYKMVIQPQHPIPELITV